MTRHRAIWLSTVVCVSLVGVVGTALVMPWTQAVGIAVCVGVFGTFIGFAFGEEFSSLRRTVLVCAALFGLSALVLPGLVHLCGPVAFGVVAALVLASPEASRPIVRLLRPHLGPPDLQRAGMADPNEALRRQWLAATAQLEEAARTSDRLLLVELRSRILDDLLERGDGRLPGYVWDSLSDRTVVPGDPPMTDKEGRQS